ncbi:hypothetical protein TB2_002457 [Malus domestica]|uniref:Uncharacterized protein n=1 Tax=Malus domestica TaxID=3750 RepID=A0A498IQL4_MALDO|nr:hypothetical protein DVH24_009361 [Malus domestica]
MEVSAVVATAAATMSVKSMELKWVSIRRKTQMEKTIKTPSKFKSPFPLQAMVPILYPQTHLTYTHPTSETSSPPATSHPTGSPITPTTTMLKPSTCTSCALLSSTA